MTETPSTPIYARTLRQLSQNGPARDTLIMMLPGLILVCGGSALKNVGVQLMLDCVTDSLPSPVDITKVAGCDPDDPKVKMDVKLDRDAPFAALAFKTITDPNGDLTFIRVYSGTLEQGTQVYNPGKRQRERIGRIYKMHAAHRDLTAAASAPDVRSLSAVATAAYVSLVEEARWFSPLREGLDAFFAAVQAPVTGHGHQRLAGGEFVTTATELSSSLPETRLPSVLSRASG